MEAIELRDTITLDDDKEYFVTGKTIYDDLEYLALFNTEDYSMKFGVLVEDQLVVLDNKEDKGIIDELIPLFLKSISQEYIELSKEENK